jgi:hypothetical protein
VRIQIIRAQCRHLVPPSEHRRFTTDSLSSWIWAYHMEGDLRAAWRCALKRWKLAPWRLGYLKTALGAGLRYLRSGRPVKTA